MNQTKTLRQLWHANATESSEAEMQSMMQQAIALSDMHLAIDISKTAIEKFGAHPTSRYYQALAYANCGSRAEVYRLLESLLASVSNQDEVYTDVLALRGRLEKDRYLRATERREKDTALANALEAYNDAYEITGASFPGINAATLFRLADAKEQSRKIAVEIITSNAGDQDGLWQLATLAEAHLLLEEYDSARHYYTEILELIGSNFGLLASVKKHIPLIDEKQKIPTDIIKMLDGPAIVVFSGHMFDAIDRKKPRFPIALRDEVAAAIGNYIDQANIKIGYSSAACGGDLIFCREMLKRGLEINIILPFSAEDFRRTSVTLAGVDESLEYWDVLKHANSVTVATDEYHLDNACLYNHAANLVEGYALLRARQCDGKVNVVAAIDPYTEGERGGTMDLTVEWLEQGLDVHIIDIGKLRGEVSTNILPSPSTRPTYRPLDRQIMTLVEVTSNANDEKVHAALKDKVPTDIEFLSGGGINRAFYNVKDAADYAYHVRTLATIVDWPKLGLPDDTTLQISIHSGPIFPRSRSKKRDYFGTHVFYARELAEVTPPNCIYLTEPAAALLLTHGPDEYVSDYLGALRVKDFTRQIYRLHRA